VFVCCISAFKEKLRTKVGLATAEGCGTAEIMRRSGKSKPVVCIPKLVAA